MKNADNEQLKMPDNRIPFASFFFFNYGIGRCCGCRCIFIGCTRLDASARVRVSVISPGQGVSLN